MAEGYDCWWRRKSEPSAIDPDRFQLDLGRADEGMVHGQDEIEHQPGVGAVGAEHQHMQRRRLEDEEQGDREDPYSS